MKGIKGRGNSMAKSVMRHLQCDVNNLCSGFECQLADFENFCPFQNLKNITNGITPLENNKAF